MAPGEAGRTSGERFLSQYASQNTTLLLTSEELIAAFGLEESGFAPLGASITTFSSDQRDD